MYWSARFLMMALIAVLPDLYIYLMRMRGANKKYVIGLWASAAVAAVECVSAFKCMSCAETAGALFGAGMCLAVALIIALPKVIYVLFDVISLAIPDEKAKVNIRKVGMGIGAFAGVLMIYAVLVGRFNMGRTDVVVRHKAVPAAFDGVKILHITDLHTGSLYGSEERVREWVREMNEAKVDVVVFTGDIVTIINDELDAFVPVLAELEAPMGKYAILGNHDYGDYHVWENEADKEANLNQLCDNVEKAGFKMLRNENVVLRRGEDSLCIVGIENWGKPPFPQRADLKKAVEGLSNESAKILLSHDPDFWQYALKEYAVVGENMFLTLSGHTHAMQAGIEIGEWECSPSVLKYEYYHGLYGREKSDGEIKQYSGKADDEAMAGQYMYVSRGIGCAGLPFRVGMSPEYVVITLKK